MSNAREIAQLTVPAALYLRLKPLPPVPDDPKDDDSCYVMPGLEADNRVRRSAAIYSSTILTMSDGFPGYHPPY